MEEWKSVVGYENFFEVSNLGRFRRKGSDKVLKQTLNHGNYFQVGTKPHGAKEKAKTFKVHREVAKAFLPNPELKEQVNHKDGNKHNNSVSNLEWVTGHENMRHASVNGLLKPRKGDNHPLMKITDSTVIQIIDEASKKEKTLRQLCNSFGITHQTVVRRYAKLTASKV